MLRNYNINTKAATIFAFTFILFSVIVFIRTMRVNNIVEEIVQKENPKVQLAYETMNNVNVVMISILDSEYNNNIDRVELNNHLNQLSSQCNLIRELIKKEGDVSSISGLDSLVSLFIDLSNDLLLNKGKLQSIKKEKNNLVEKTIKEIFSELTRNTNRLTNKKLEQITKLETNLFYFIASTKGFDDTSISALKLDKSESYKASFERTYNNVSDLKLDPNEIKAMKSLGEVWDNIIELTISQQDFNVKIMHEITSLHNVQLRLHNLLTLKLQKEARDIIVEDELDAYQSSYRMFGELIVTGLVMVIAFLIFSRTISIPLRKLVSHTEKIGRGLLELNVDKLARNDEIGHLYTAFHEMISNLRVITASRDELNKEILKRIRIEKELITAKCLAEESNRLKTVFMNTVSHELRTPLNHILGFSALIPSQTNDCKIIEYSEYIQKSGNKLLAMITDLLEVALLDKNEISIKNEPISINALFSDIKVLVRKLLEAESKKKDIKLDINSGVANENVILCDKNKIFKIASCLVDNAVKFTYTGSIKVTQEFINDTIILSFSDTGIGIPKDKQQAIFKPFAQVDDSSSREFQGMGIGLSIASKLAKKLNGNIVVNSVPGIGSEFILKVPVLTI